jgi:hypothetical protein
MGIELVFYLGRPTLAVECKYTFGVQGWIALYSSSTGCDMEAGKAVMATKGWREW